MMLWAKNNGLCKILRIIILSMIIYGVFSIVATDITSSNISKADYTLGLFQPEDKKCPDPVEARSDFDGCLLCPVFEKLFDASSYMSQKAWETTSGGAINLLALGFVAWLILYILPQLGAIDKLNTNKLWDDFIEKIFKVIIAFILLSIPTSQFYGLFLGPVFEGGMNIANEILGSDCSQVSTGGQVGAFPMAMKTSIVCAIENIQGRLADGMTVGRVALCFGWKVDLAWDIIPNFGMMLIGAIILIVFTLLMIVVPFLLIDCIIRLGIVGAIMPMAIVCWAFKFTAQYTKKTWEMFVNVFFKFIFLVMVIVTILSMCQAMLNGGSGDSAVNIQQAVQQNNIDDILNAFSWSGGKFLKLVAVIIFGLVLLENSDGLSSGFGNSGGGGDDIGGKVATAGMSAVRGGGKKLGGAAMTGAGVMAAKAINDASEGVNSIRHRARVAFSNVGNKTGLGKGTTALAITNSAGALVKTSNSLDKKGNQVETKSTQQNGKRVLLEKTTTDKNGNITKVMDDGFVKITQVIGADGKVKEEKVNMRPGFSRNMFNRDGSINKNLIAQSGLKKSDLDRIVNKEIAKKHIGRDASKYSNCVKSEFTNEKSRFGGVADVTTETKADGAIETYRTETAKNGRTFSTYTIEKDGKIIKIETDGIIVKETVTKGDKPPQIFYRQHQNTPKKHDIMFQEKNDSFGDDGKRFFKTVKDEKMKEILKRSAFDVEDVAAFYNRIKK